MSWAAPRPPLACELERAPTSLANRPPDLASPCPPVLILRATQLDTAVLPAQGTLIASMGSVMLMDMDAPVQLYQAWPQHLAYRACTLTQLR